MKKWFFVFLAIIVIALVAVYLMIPVKEEIARTAYFDIGSDIVHRHLSDQSTWDRWWPGTPGADTGLKVQPVHFIEETGYTVSHKLFNAVEVQIISDADTIRSTILIVPLKPDSTVLHWSGTIETGLNPIHKVRQHRQATHIRKHMARILAGLEGFLADRRNVYTISIDRSLVKDTLLISTKKDLDHYPDTHEIYDLVGSLKKYIAQHAAKEMNYPMLNIAKVNENGFRVMVAIPVDKALGDNGPFAFKRMVPGNILVTNVTGGRYRIEKALEQLELYIKENKLTSPAIPFESMVTDRSKEADTSKWVTRIYYPIL